MSLSRRELLGRTALGAGALAVGRFSGLLAAQPASAKTVGELVADPNGVLDLPPGFHYSVISLAGSPMAGSGLATPGRPDGMAAFSDGKGVRIVLNHEIGASDPNPTLADPSLTYDPKAKGGTTTLVLDKHLDQVEQYVSVAGTWSNCAGGRTPWGTWLTCEETEQKKGSSADKDHGFVFEVDPAKPSNNVNPTPLKALGRFAHEAVAIDPRSNWVYLSEDGSSPNGLVYRFIPSDTSGGYGSLRNGGTLTAMQCSKNGTHVPDLSVFSTPGTTLNVAWVAIADTQATTTSIRKQFTNNQVTRSRKFEGMWWGQGVHIVCSFARLSDGSLAEHDGQVWIYNPDNQTLTLELFLPLNPDYSSDIPDGPDNIAVSPYGGFFLAEDGIGTQHLLTVDERGNATPFARNALSESEFTGVNFAPDGKALFASIQDEGITVAITGPFSRLP